MTDSVEHPLIEHLIAEMDQALAQLAQLDRPSHTDAEMGMHMVTWYLLAALVAKIDSPQQGTKNPTRPGPTCQYLLQALDHYERIATDVQAKSKPDTHVEASVGLQVALVHVRGFLLSQQQEPPQQP